MLTERFCWSRARPVVLGRDKYGRWTLETHYLRRQRITDCRIKASTNYPLLFPPKSVVSLESNGTAFRLQACEEVM